MRKSCAASPAGLGNHLKNLNPDTPPTTNSRKPGSHQLDVEKKLRL